MGSEKLHENEYRLRRAEVQEWLEDRTKACYSDEIDKLVESRYELY